MNKAAKISSIFPKHLFWDVKMDHLEALGDQDLIIPRALYMTSEKTFEDDISKLEIFYSSDVIVRNLKLTKARLSSRVYEMVAQRYQIPLFRR